MVEVDPVILVAAAASLIGVVLAFVCLRPSGDAKTKKKKSKPGKGKKKSIKSKKKKDDKTVTGTSSIDNVLSEHAELAPAPAQPVVKEVEATPKPYPVTSRKKRADNATVVTASSTVTVGDGVVRSEAVETLASNRNKNEDQLIFAEWLPYLASQAENPEHRRPLPLYQDPFKYYDTLVGTDKDKGCIISEPTVTMGHRMIDFDVPAAVAKVLTMARDAIPDGRGKPVIAVVRGMGGGKTRCLEEIRRELLRHGRGEVLPIGITFNNNSGPSEDVWLGKDEFTYLSVHQKFAISVTARIVSAVFGIPYEEMAALVSKQLEQLDSNSLPTAEEMIRHAIRFVVVAVNDSRKELREASAASVAVYQNNPLLSIVPDIDTVAVMLDESAIMDELLKWGDLANVGRSALLNKVIMLGLSATLVMTRLQFLPTVLCTNSNRDVIVLDVPNRLNSTIVVDDWWRMKDATPAEKNSLRLVAASMNSMPRALQIAAQFLKLNHRSKISKGGEDRISPTINGHFVQRMYADVFEKVYVKYSKLRCPSIRLLAAVFFEQLVLVDAEVLKAIEGSFVTNPMIEFSAESYIVPETSIVALKAVADRVCRTVKVAKRRTKIQKLVIGIANGIDSILGKIGNYQDEGDILEVALKLVLLNRIRIFLAVGAETDAVSGLPVPKTLARLCGLEDALSDPNIWGELNQSVLDIFCSLQLTLDPNAGVRGTTLTTSSRNKDDNNHTAYLAELDAVKVNAAFPFALILPQPGEAWDVAIKCYDGSSNGRRSFYVFFDAKSVREHEEEAKMTTKPERIVKLMKGPHQYTHTVGVLGGATTRPYLYVYVSTHNVSSCAVGKSGILLGRNDSVSLLGPFAEVYKAARDASRRR